MGSLEAGCQGHLNDAILAKSAKCWEPQGWRSSLLFDYGYKSVKSMHLVAGLELETDLHATCHVVLSHSAKAGVPAARSRAS